jgi:hypothetical protein
MKLAIALLLLSIQLTVAQSLSEEENDIAEDVLSLNENDEHDGQSFEQLSQLLNHRRDINSITVAELRALPFLTDVQIDELVRHRESSGEILSPYELQVLDHFDEATIRSLLKVVSWKPPSERMDKSVVNRLVNESDRYLMMMSSLNLQRKAGFKGDGDGKEFHGSRLRTMCRFRSSKPGDFSTGFTLELDEGESFKWKPKQKQFGTDHVSAHLQLLNKGRVKNLIAGDFQYQAGQSLVWGGASGFGKGAETITTTRKAHAGLMPYTSAYESGYLRGAAVTIKLSKRIDITALYSNTYRDASRSPLNDDDPIISSIVTTGLHRSDNELSKRKQLHERIAGATATYAAADLNAGVNFQHVSYSIPIRRKANPYNQHSFQGQSNTNAGAFFFWTHHNVTAFGEVAKTVNGGTAYLGGALLSLGRNIDVALLHRNYSPHYQPFFANAFSESTLPQNERGIYWGWKFKITRRISLGGYFDMFEFPWLKFRTYAPTTGLEWLARLSWQPNRKTLVYVQARDERKSRNTEDTDVVYKVAHVVKRNYWISIEHEILPSLKMKSRLQWTTFTQGAQTTSGFLLYHDIAAHVNKFMITARYAVFDTDSYDNRMYAYENDVWLSFSIPAYFGKGVRQYLMVQYKFNRSFTVWLRYGYTRYHGVDHIGSSVDEIPGSVKSDVKLEVRYAF